MEVYYLLIVGFLFLLAVSLLIVGVSNDAVNFLNSAIGAKAAPLKLIILIAGAGVLVGAVFSNGMMEVARKGIFNPEFFSFSEIMTIFLAVMLTNLLLLDFFNTLGLPTSTTVSIVFGILGAAVGVGVFKHASAALTGSSVADYINIESSVMIVVGIFLSVAIAFTAGTIIQWIVRLAFTFNLKKTGRYFTGIWGGFAITAILYFLIMKGARGSTLVSEEMIDFINRNNLAILLISFAGWSLVFQFLVSFTRVNILKIIVMAGTFALAMAFAGNDLVNFIGVPLAGFESFKEFMATGGSNPDGLMMGALTRPVDTPVFFLLTAGMVMVFTLMYSKKARSVTATTIDLSRQGEGSERFASSVFARFIVRKSVELSNGIAKITPPLLSSFIEKRFEAFQSKEDKKEKLAFDLVRASVNLVVASILIAFGTSHKLPLSTTYVTFMVAMGSSLADGAWGRDSAVYRITGVLTVIGGWFFTAFIAFLASFVLAAIIFYGKWPLILALAALAVYILLKTHAFHKRRAEKEEKKWVESKTLSAEIIKNTDEEVRKLLQKLSFIIQQTYSGFLKEKHKEIKKLRQETRELCAFVKDLREDIPRTLRKFEEHDLLSGHSYVLVMGQMKEICQDALQIVQPAFNHLDNNHAMDKEQVESIKEFNEMLGEFFKLAMKILKAKNAEGLVELEIRKGKLDQKAGEILMNRIRILKNMRKGSKAGLTYIEMLSGTEILLRDMVQLVRTDLILLNGHLNPEKSVALTT